MIDEVGERDRGAPLVRTRWGLLPAGGPVVLGLVRESAEARWEARTRPVAGTNVGWGLVECDRILVRVMPDAPGDQGSVVEEIQTTLSARFGPGQGR